MCNPNSDEKVVCLPGNEIKQRKIRNLTRITIEIPKSWGAKENGNLNGYDKDQPVF